MRFKRPVRHSQRLPLISVSLIANLLHEGKIITLPYKMVRSVRLELTTLRVRAESSTLELRTHKQIDFGFLVKTSGITRFAFNFGLL